MAGVEELISVHEEFDHSINRIQRAYLKAQNPNEEIGGVISGESDVGELSESDWTGECLRSVTCSVVRRICR